MARGWTPIDEDPRWQDEAYFDSVKATLDGLAQWWSQLHDADEQDGWARQRQIEDGDDYGIEFPRRSWYAPGPEGDAEYKTDEAACEAELKSYEDTRKAKNAMRDEQALYIEHRIEELGARMMRPYEHWNEDEAFMAYSERDR